MSRFGHYPASHADLHACWLSFQKEDSPTLRFGQWLYNRYVHDGKPWPELFYKDGWDAYLIALSEITNVS